MQTSAPTTATQRLRKRVENLRAALGSQCRVCQAETGLQFDCIIPQGWVRHGNGGKARIQFYWQQHLVGNLQLLCRSCHTSKTIQDNIILRRARASAPALAAALVGPTTEGAEPMTPKPVKHLHQQAGESDWAYKCRRERERLGIA